MIADRTANGRQGPAYGHPVGEPFGRRSPPGVEEDRIEPRSACAFDIGTRVADMNRSGHRRPDPLESDTEELRIGLSDATTPSDGHRVNVRSKRRPSEFLPLEVRRAVRDDEDAALLGEFPQKPGCAIDRTQLIEPPPSVCVRERFDRRVGDGYPDGVEGGFERSPTDGSVGGPVGQPYIESLTKGGSIRLDGGQRDRCVEFGTNVLERAFPWFRAGDERVVEIKAYHGH